MRPGPPAVCNGTVLHARSRPAPHQFSYRVSQIWFDPSEPEALTRLHPLWSSRRPAPGRIRLGDYGPDQDEDGSSEWSDQAEVARRDLAPLLGARPAGPVRMLTQARRWGWLFNPISLVLVWDGADSDPVGAILEVTNTPWKERTRYPTLLTPGQRRGVEGWTASVDKTLHVSPFLDEDYEYRVWLADLDDAVDFSIDVHRAGDDSPVVATRLRLSRADADRSLLGRALTRDALSTRTVSAGIHTQAARLGLKGVPFVAHPDKRVASPRADRTTHDPPTGTSSPMTAHQQARVSPDALLARSQSSRPGVASVNAFSIRACRRLGHEVLERIRRDHLTVIDHTVGPAQRPRVTMYGSADVLDRALSATVEIHDPRAWTSLVGEGAIGFGRGYFESWWDSDDPTAVVQIAARNMAPLDELRNAIQRRTGWATDRLRRLLPAPDRARNKEDIGSHYDLGNDFFSLFLDQTMTYSSGVFPSPGAALADASLNKYDRLLTKLGVTSDHHVLEIGTGWGGFALRAVEATGCDVTTTTISAEQLAEAQRRVTEAGETDRISLLDIDWRDLDGTFDRIISIEMIEAVHWRDYDQYFATIESCLDPGGLVAIQAICLPDRRYERAKNTEDFIARFVFPGGIIPSVGAISKSVSSATRLQVLDVEDLSAHYAETLKRWRENFDERIDEVKALGLDERFCRLWRFYLAYCEAGFRERHCTVNQIILAGPDWRPDGLALRPF